MHLLKTVMTQVQDLAFHLAEPLTIGLDPLFQPVQILLHRSTLWQINAPTQHGVICKLAKGALAPLIQVVEDDIK